MDRWFEELADDAEAEGSLELGAAGSQRRESGPRRERAGGVGERGLADPGRSLDEQRLGLCPPRRGRHAVASAASSTWRPSSSLPSVTAVGDFTGHVEVTKVNTSIEGGGVASQPSVAPFVVAVRGWALAAGANGDRQLGAWYRG